MRKILLVGATAATLTVGLAVPAAGAPSTDETDVTFTIDAGTLDITAPPTAALVASAGPRIFTGSLGDVGVTDGRGDADASWSATVTSTDFFRAGSTPTGADIVDNDYATYNSGGPSSTVGNGTFSGTVPTGGSPQPLGGTVVAFKHVGGTGNNTSTWGPTVAVDVTMANVAGDYSGVMTHSVA